MVVCAFGFCSAFAMNPLSIPDRFDPAAVSGLRSYPICFLVFLLVLTGCATPVPPPTYPQTLLSKDDFIFEGGFVLPDEQYGVSSTNWTQGVIEVHNGALYIVGNEQEDAIAQFTIPQTLGFTGDVESLPTIGNPLQPFAGVFDRIQNNRDGMDSIVGLEVFEGKLFANAIEYYDAPADNRQTTFVINESSNLARSSIRGPYALKGSAKAAGWLSAVPVEWQKQLGCSHISGSSSGRPIITRFSIGPSAWCVDLQVFDEKTPKQTIPARELLGFDLKYPLAEDLLNESLDNELWTHLSQATYGFIVPGTATYATFGYSGGHRSGVGYKLTRNNGEDCSGYCAANPADTENYYWFWDVRDLWRVALGRKAASEVRPYEWGEWNVPLNARDFRFGGGAYDDVTGRLYFTLLNLKYDAERGVNPPAVIGYRIGG